MSEERIKRPKWIWICGQIVRVRFVKNPTDHHGDPKLACWDGERALIQIKKSLDPEIQRVSLVHELLHAMWYMTGAGTVLEGIRMGSYKEADHFSAEEALTGVLESGLWTLLVGNPDLMRWLRPEPE